MLARGVVVATVARARVPCVLSGLSDESDGVTGDALLATTTSLARAPPRLMTHAPLATGTRSPWQPQGTPVHPTAKKCIQWSVGLFVVGAVLMVYLPDLYFAITTVAGANADAGLEVLNVAFMLLRSTMMPVGAALVGAAVVIQALAGGTQRPAEDLDRNRNRAHTRDA